MNITQRGIVTLLKSAVTGEKLALPEGFSLEEAFPVIRRHSVVPLAYEGAVNCGISKDNPVMRQMLTIYYRRLVQSEQQMRAVDQVFRAFEENGIDYMPVKGCVIRHLYPKPELRSMGDADILIRMEQHERICPIMQSLGFVLQPDNDHVFYWKSPALNVELHKCLTPPMDQDYYAYYGTGWRLAVKQEGTRHALPVEDHFIFLFTHFARHYRFSGIGSRHVVDLYVYRRAYPSMDERYILRELSKLRLGEFYYNITRMLDVWFADGTPDEVTQYITEFIFSGGNWGTWEAHLVSTEVRRAGKASVIKNTKFKSALRAVFPSSDVMKRQYPVLAKMPFLLPLFWMLRLLDVLLFRRKAITKRRKMIQLVNDEKASAYQKALNYVGLDFRFEEEP